MLPELKQNVVTEITNCYFRDDITVDDIIKHTEDDSTENKYILKNGESSEYLTEKEYDVIIPIIKNNRELLNALDNSVVLAESKKYIAIEKIQIPIEYYNIEVIQKLESNNYQEFEWYYDFTNCKEYFITQCPDYHKMTILINIGYENGYKLIFRDPERLIVEMSKSSQLGI